MAFARTHRYVQPPPSHAALSLRSGNTPALGGNAATLSGMSERGSAQLVDDGSRITIRGDWTLEHISELAALCAQMRKAARSDVALDIEVESRIDTAGASVLLDLVAGDSQRVLTANDATRQLIAAVARAEGVPPPKRKRDAGFLGIVANVGNALEAMWRNTLGLVGFIGLILSSFARSALRPSQWRTTSTVAHIEQTGLNATPIVALLCFLVGAVVAFLGAVVLRDFGASIFTVELVGYSFLRDNI